MPLATIALLCKQTSDNFRTCPPPERSMAPSIRKLVIICSSLEIFSQIIESCESYWVELLKESNIVIFLAVTSIDYKDFVFRINVKCTTNIIGKKLV